MKKIILFLLSLGIAGHTFGMESLSVLNIDNLSFISLQDFIQTKTKFLKEKHNLALNLALEKKLNLAQTNAHLLFAFGNQFKEFKRQMKLRLVNAEQAHYDALSSALKKEQEVHNQNYYVLYHSTKAYLYAMHYIDTQLYALEQELLHNNIIPMTILKLRQDTSFTFASDTQHAEKRNHFINNGTYNDYMDQEFLLSCNFALTGNILRSGSCTIDYWLTSRNIQAPKIKLKTLIHTCFGDQHDNFVAALEHAIKTFYSQCKTGVLLQLIFKSPHLLQECVYPSKPLGIKKNVFIKNDTEVRETYDPADILDALCQNPADVSDIDSLQFRVVLTKDKLLDITNPEIYNNFEIYAYCSPMDALETFHNAVQDTITKIRESYLAYQGVES